MLFSKKIIRHDENEEFSSLLYRAQELYPDDISKQIDFFEKQPSQYRTLGIISLVQIYLAENYDRRLDISSNTLEFIFRSLLDLTRHLQDKLPDGVYDYNYDNLNFPIKNIIKQIEKINAERKV